MIIAVEGCAHGELEKIYDTIEFLEGENNLKVDVLLCCGDFQATRNAGDLECMAVPPKYRSMCTFHKYYSGEKTAPMLTIIIGGNHEASNYFQELPYGGWVAPNIYYLGYAGVVNIADVRIGGLSGIFKSADYRRGRFERLPYDQSSVRSCYHIRSLDVFRLKQLSKSLNIMLSHDWPRGVYNYGNINQLLRWKPFFEQEVMTNTLGSQPAADLLECLKPHHWFSAHLHVKFPAIVKHEDGSETKFLALDKCLPRRQFLQLVTIPHNGDIKLSYDLEWLTILKLTNHLINVRTTTSHMPGPGCGERWDFTPTEEEKNDVLKLMGDLVIPENFVKTAPVFDPNVDYESPIHLPNPQTHKFCNQLGVSDPLQRLLELNHDRSISNLDNSSLADYSSFQISADNVSLNELIPTQPEIHSDCIKEQPVSFSTPYRSKPIQELSDKDTTATTDHDNSQVPTEPENTTSEAVTEPNDDNRPSGPKKFRRRNLAMYASTDDDA